MQAEAQPEGEAALLALGGLDPRVAAGQLDEHVVAVGANRRGPPAEVLLAPGRQRVGVEALPGLRRSAARRAVPPVPRPGRGRPPRPAGPASPGAPGAPRPVPPRPPPAGRPTRRGWSGSPASARPPDWRRSAPRWRSARSVSSIAVAERRCRLARASSSSARRSAGAPWMTARSSGENTVTGTASARSARRARWRFTWDRDSPGPRVSSVSTETRRPPSSAPPGRSPAPSPSESWRRGGRPGTTAEIPGRPPPRERSSCRCRSGP